MVHFVWAKARIAAALGGRPSMAVRLLGRTDRVNLARQRVAAGVGRHARHLDVCSRLFEAKAIDLPQAVARARIRAGQRGLTQVQFVEGDIHEPAPGGPFDAIIGRLVLMHVPDPPAVLRQQATVLRPGGLVAPIEFDLATARALPAIPLVSQAVSWLTEAFTRGGIGLRSARGCGACSARQGCVRWGCWESSRTSDPSIRTVLPCWLGSSERPRR